MPRTFTEEELLSDLAEIRAENTNKLKVLAQQEAGDSQSEDEPEYNILAGLAPVRPRASQVNTLAVQTKINLRSRRRRQVEHAAAAEPVKLPKTAASSKSASNTAIAMDSDSESDSEIAHTAMRNPRPTLKSHRLRIIKPKVESEMSVDDYVAHRVKQGVSNEKKLKAALAAKKPNEQQIITLFFDSLFDPCKQWDIKSDPGGVTTIGDVKAYDALIHTLIRQHFIGAVWKRFTIGLSLIKLWESFINYKSKGVEGRMFATYLKLATPESRKKHFVKHPNQFLDAPAPNGLFVGAKWRTGVLSDGRETTGKFILRLPDNPSVRKLQEICSSWQAGALLCIKKASMLEPVPIAEPKWLCDPFKLNRVALNVWTILLVALPGTSASRCKINHCPETKTIFLEFRVDRYGDMADPTEMHEEHEDFDGMVIHYKLEPPSQVKSKQINDVCIQRYRQSSFWQITATLT